MGRNEFAASRMVSRALTEIRGGENRDPITYSAEIATAGMICAILMLMVIALP
jgi:hypothetical protein